MKSKVFRVRQGLRNAHSKGNENESEVNIITPDHKLIHFMDKYAHLQYLWLSNVETNRNTY